MSGLEKCIDKWYQDHLTKTVEAATDHALKFAVIVTYPEPKVLAVYPKDFVPDEKGIRDIIAALHDGDTSEIAEHGMYLGMGCARGTPGKMDPGKAIYGSDGGEGGTDAFVAEKSLLMGCYIKRPAASTRLLRNAALFMVDQEK